MTDTKAAAADRSAAPAKLVHLHITEKERSLMAAALQSRWNFLRLELQIQPCDAASAAEFNQTEQLLEHIARQ